MTETDHKPGFTMPGAIFDSREELTAYLAYVRTRREERRQARELLGHWEVAGRKGSGGCAIGPGGGGEAGGAVRRIEAFRAEIEAVAAKVEELSAEGLLNKNGALNRSHSFGLRGLACSLNAIYARAFDERMERSLLPALRSVRDT